MIPSSDYLVRRLRLRHLELLVRQRQPARGSSYMKGEFGSSTATVRFALRRCISILQLSRQ